MINFTPMIDLKANWINLVKKHNTDELLADKIFSELMSAYDEDGRHYHNSVHISKMLACAERWKEKANDHDALSFTIWYHDVVYNALKSDNEERSADVAENDLRRIGYPQEKIDKVKEMILRTKKHTEWSNDDADTALLLDLDLAILGAERSEYEEYRQQVRKEYGWVPGIMYNRGRRNVLQQFLDAEHIYRLQEFRNTLEEKARENLRFEIQQLS